MHRVTRVLLGLLVFTLPFDQAFEIPVIGSLSRAVGLLTALAGLLALLSSRIIVVRRISLFLTGAAVFVAWNIVSNIWTIDRAVSLSHAFTYVQLWILAWLLWQFINTPTQGRQLRQWYMMGTWVTILTIVWAYVTQGPTADAMRYTAFHTNENYTAQSIALAIPMAFAATRHESRFRRFMAAALIPASIIAIVLTGSRGGAIIAMVTLAGGFLLIMRSRALVRIVMLAGLMLLVGSAATMLPTSMIERFGTTVDQVRSADFSGRGEIWQAAFDTWLSRPALGTGTGSFDDAVVPFLGYSQASHNAFLGLLVELGPLGPYLFLLLFLIAIWPHIQHLWKRGDSEVGRTRDDAALHVVLIITLLVAQIPTNWQYQRVTWYVLTAATLDGAILLRAARPVGLLRRTHHA